MVWAALTMSLILGLLPVLLARLLDLRWSGVVSMLLVCPGGVPVWSKIPLSPLVLRPDKFWVKVGHPWCWNSLGPGCQAGGICCRKGGGEGG